MDANGHREINIQRRRAERDQIHGWCCPSTASMGDLMRSQGVGVPVRQGERRLPRWARTEISAEGKGGSDGPREGRGPRERSTWHGRISLIACPPMASHLPRDGRLFPCAISFSNIKSQHWNWAGRQRSHSSLTSLHRRHPHHLMGESSSSSSPGSYIHMVQHLIEKCLLFHLDKDESMEALSKHANINPVITATVWSELEKENKEFFEAYSKNREKSVTEMRIMQMVKTTLTFHRPDN